MAYGIYPGTPTAPTAPRKPAASDVFSGTVNGAQAVARDAQPGAASTALGAPAPSPFGGVAGATAFGPAANPGGFESLLNNATPARAQNVQAANQSISDMLMAPTGPSRESAAARSAFLKGQAEAARQEREDSTGAGRLATGQLGGDMRRFNDRALAQRADLENQLAIQDGQRADQNRQAGISSLLSMESLGEQARGTAAQNALTARGQDVTMRGQDIQERMGDKSLAVTREENALDRALNKETFYERLGLDKLQFNESIRQFNSREDFDRWAKTQDLDEGERNRVWKAQQDDVQRKWSTGERLSGQEHEVLLEKLREEGEVRKMERNQVLNLQTLEQQQAHEEKILGLKNTYDTLRMREGFSHEETMTNLEGQIQSMLSSQGYTQEQALQGARLEVQRIEGERTREMEERISMAKLALDSDIAAQELGIKRESLDLTRKQVESDLAAAGFALGDAKLQQAAGLASVLLEKWGDNPDTQAKAAEILYGALRFTEPPMISDEEYKLGVLASKRAGFKDEASFQAWARGQGYTTDQVGKVLQAPGPATGVSSTPGTEASAQSAADKLEALNLPQGVDRAKISTELARVGTTNFKPASDLAKLKSLPGFSANIAYGAIPGYETRGKTTTREATDYMGFHNLMELGVPEKEAADLAITSIGLDRFKAAFRALTGREWNG